MKRIIKNIMPLLLLVVMGAALFGCGETTTDGPSGTYAVGDNLTYLIFEEDQVTLKMGQMTATGTWELDGDKLTLTYDNNAGEKEYTYDAQTDTITAENGEVLKWESN